MIDVTLGGLLRRIEQELAQAQIGNPQLDARILIAHALGLDRAQLLSQSECILGTTEQGKINWLINRRLKREPVSRILGAREFWSLPFALNEATLVPRPESETLVAVALKGTPGNARILDLGTGSGCLLLALLHERPEATGLGIDIAPRAVEQARENAERLDLAARAEFRVGNWLEGIEEKFDVIVSNPPYISGSEIADLMPEVRDHDPHLALDGGNDGLAAYRILIPRLSRLLKPKGITAFEIGEGQANAVRDIFVLAKFNNISTHRDLAGNERCISASID
jgi:release factor glutamine methyltransferase